MCEKMIPLAIFVLALAIAVVLIIGMLIFVNAPTWKQMKEATLTYLVAGAITSLIASPLAILIGFQNGALAILIIALVMGYAMAGAISIIAK